MIGSLEYGVSMVSSLSPDSVELELIFSSLPSKPQPDGAGALVRELGTR